ncbi:hypothetical protein [Priestia megaterium]|uniref:hypothetical protein n=1 Tax=Priestia megaterium TaxID=1404 RepID=UPI00164983F7|nr:hypothetical protein [Priestia megaterium]
MVNIVLSVSFFLVVDWRASDEEAQRPPAESEALPGNQLRWNKQSNSCISFVRL